MGHTAAPAAKAGANIAGAGYRPEIGRWKRCPVSVAPAAGFTCQPNWGRSSMSPDKLAQQGGDTFISSRLVLLAMLEQRLPRKAAEGGLTAIALQGAIERHPNAGGEGRSSNPEGGKTSARPGPYTIDLTARAEQASWTRVDRSRRRDPPHHPGAAAPDQNNPVLIGELRRGQDRHCRGSGPADRQWRGAGGPARHNGASCPGHGAPCWRAPSSGDFEERLKAVLNDLAQDEGRSSCSSTAAHHGRRRQPASAMDGQHAGSPRWRVASCTASAPPRWMSTASMWKGCRPGTAFFKGA